MENPQANEQPQAPLKYKRALNNLLAELYNSISVYLRSEDRAKARRAGFALKKRNAEDEMEAKEGAIAKLKELERRGFPEDLALRVRLILKTKVEGVPLVINLESEGAQNLRLLWEEIERWREAVALYNGNEQQFPYWIMPLEDISLVEDTNEEEPPPSSDTNRQAIEDTGNGAIAQLKAAEATKAPSVISNDRPVEPVIGAIARDAATVQALSLDSTVPAPPKRVSSLKPGRPMESNPTRDAKTYNDWQAAKASGTSSIKQFANDRGKRPKAVEKAIKRHTKRLSKQRSNAV